MVMTWLWCNSRSRIAVATTGSPKVACVKFCKLVVEAGEDLLLLSIAAVAAWRVDRQQFVEVDLGDGLELLGHGGSLQAFRQSIEPGTVFVLERDQRGDRGRPTFRPWRATWRRRCGRGP